MISNDFECLSEIFSDMKRRAAFLWQLSFLQGYEINETVLHRSIFVFRDKGKGLDSCYSAAYYISQTRDQQRCTISEVAADWREPMVPQRIMWTSIACADKQPDPRCS